MTTTTDLKVRSEELTQALMGAWVQELTSDNHRFEPMAIYASGRRKCVRAMALDLVAWDKKPDFEPQALERMRRGKEREKDLIARLIRVGQLSKPSFDVIHEQKGEYLRDRKGRIIIRMRIDGRLKFETGETPPFEIKRYDPTIAQGINNMEDFDKSPWTRNAPDQLLAYLLAHNEPWGFFLLETRGLPKLIPVYLEDHLDRAESFLRDAETAMDAKEMYPTLGETILPPFINDASECRRCQHFGRSCQPPLDFGQGAQVISDPELEALLQRREELSPLSKEYATIDRSIKDRFQGVELAIVGNFQVTGEWKERSVKAIDARMDRYFQIKVEKIR